VGFKIEGQLRKAYFRRGKFRDTCIMGLLNGELTQDSKSV
jgi:RimJ/RimL family protein N-acetyltransferase